METKVDGGNSKVAAGPTHSSLREAEEAFAAALALVRDCAARAKAESVGADKNDEGNGCPGDASPPLRGPSSTQAELLAAQQAFAAARASVREWKRRGATYKAHSEGSANDGATAAALPPNPAWAYYPAPVVEVPREANDPRFTHSFDLTHSHDRPAAEVEAEAKAARAFFEEWGFVVFANVLSAQECSDTLSEIWATLEERTPGLNREDASTYALLSPQRYGLPDEQAVFTPQIVKNRQSPNVYAALDCITPKWSPPREDGEHAGGDVDAAVAVTTGIARSSPKHPDASSSLASSYSAAVGARVEGSVNSNSLVLSADRWCLYPPSQGNPDRQTPNPAVHLDLCPWTYPRDGPRRTPAIATNTTSSNSKITSNRSDSSPSSPSQTFQRKLSPAAAPSADADTNADLLRYHRESDFRAEFGLVKEENGPHHQGAIALVDNLEADGGTVVVPKFAAHFNEWRKHLGSWASNRVGQRRRGLAYQFSDPRDPIHGLARRVPIRKGSLVVWNQTTVHGAWPNHSSQVRCAQFVRGLRLGEFSVARRRARARALKEVLGKSGLLDDLLPLGKHVFGFIDKEEEVEEADEQKVDDGK